MKRRLDILVDRGCWISDDRMYAFVSARGGVSELGYHGNQPVSRNSRILVRESGVFLFSVRSGDGAEHALTFNEVEWMPGGVSAEFSFPGGEILLRLRASGRDLSVYWSGSFSRPVVLVVRASKDSCYTDVQGERTWRPARAADNGVFLVCRDRISLRSWLERTGPYAGDFLIPEPWRRVIFKGRKRSGLATKEDLRSMFRHADFPLYDALVSVSLGGNGFTLSEESDTWVFEHGCRAHFPIDAHFVVRCGDGGEETRERKAAVPREVEAILPRSSPRLSLEGFPHWKEFFSSVPALVESCVVRDFGVPRACPGRYYWLWAWDMLVTVSEALRWGDLELGRRTARFVNAHRDVNGVIPARWTRSLLPLDTPSPGGIEFLYGALAYENFLEGGGIQELLDAYPMIRARLAAASPDLLEKGILRGEGFYPDLLSSFGRNEQSAVSMEVGSWYSICRILQNIARCLGDPGTERLAEECASSIARKFVDRFWDEESGFFSDSVQEATGLRSGGHPLFALLFLHSPLGLSLIRRKVDRAAAFVAEHLMTAWGVRTIPLEEDRQGAEALLDSWYPHWDIYALKLLRRAGDAEAIMGWLRKSEKVLEGLGYCPEFLALRGFREADPDAWSRHGAASNLNCVTGWYRAMRESVCGIEIDPGGLTHIPLSLPLGRAAIEGIHWRGGLWTIEVMYDGPHVEEIRVDDTVLAGCFKVPALFSVPGEHRLVIRYGNREPGSYFGELVNAEIKRVSSERDAVEIEFSALGYVDGTFFSPGPPVVSVDGRPIEVVWDGNTGKGFFVLKLEGSHILRLEPLSSDRH